MSACCVGDCDRPQSVVIADEPETGLDPVLRRAVIELLVKGSSNGAGLVLISHHEDTVERIADVVRLTPMFRRVCDCLCERFGQDF